MKKLRGHLAAAITAAQAAVMHNETAATSVGAFDEHGDWLGTVYVRVADSRTDSHNALAEAFTFGTAKQATFYVVVADAWIAEDGDCLPSENPASRESLIAAVLRPGKGIIGGLHFLPYGREDDGVIRWEEPYEAEPEQSVWVGVLDAVTSQYVDLAEPAIIVAALQASGHTVITNLEKERP